MKITIPYYLHKAGAGFPSPATDYIEEDIDLNVHLIRNVPATFVIRVPVSYTHLTLPTILLV